MPFLSMLLSALDRRTQAALPCPCDYSLFKESGATVNHCAVLQEVRFTAHSQHSLGFLCQVTMSCVYFLCFLSASTLQDFSDIHQTIEKRGWHYLSYWEEVFHSDECIFISSGIYFSHREGLCVVLLCGLYFGVALNSQVSIRSAERSFSPPKPKKNLNQFQIKQSIQWTLSLTDTLVTA